MQWTNVEPIAANVESIAANCWPSNMYCSGYKRHLYIMGWRQDDRTVVMADLIGSWMSSIDSPRSDYIRKMFLTFALYAKRDLPTQSSPRPSSRLRNVAERFLCAFAFSHAKSQDQQKICRSGKIPDTGRIHQSACSKKISQIYKESQTTFLIGECIFWPRVNKQRHSKSSLSSSAQRSTTSILYNRHII